LITIDKGRTFGIINTGNGNDLRDIPVGGSEDELIGGEGAFCGVKRIEGDDDISGGSNTEGDPEGSGGATFTGDEPTSWRVDIDDEKVKEAITDGLNDVGAVGGERNDRATNG